DDGAIRSSVAKLFHSVACGGGTISAARSMTAAKDERSDAFGNRPRNTPSASATRGGRLRVQNRTFSRAKRRYGHSSQRLARLTDPSVCFWKMAAPAPK